jgi:alpha,alpha-trehalase
MKNETLLQFKPEDLELALRHIESHWQQLEKYNPKDKGTLIGLPHPYLVPSADSSTGFSFEEMYYWDSYFTAVGLLGTSRQRLAFGMLDNLVFLLNRFGMIPNGGRFYLTSHSQPPFLSSFIMDLYALKKDPRWLATRMEVAKREYYNVWMGERHPHWRNVFNGLSRYYDANAVHDLAEAESGWDMTTRFGRRCLDYLPVDLNALLYRYEKDFERTAKILEEPIEAKMWERRASARKKMVNKYMWNKEAGFYFDYNFIKGEQGKVWSLAGYYPMWAGMVSIEQANSLVANLSKFEQSGGLTTTTNYQKSKVSAQWAYPNGWAPLHFLVSYGLEAYGYSLEAQRIVRKWLQTNLGQFEKHGVFFEKYNVARPDKPARVGLYPHQSGFGWTNAVFYRLAVDFLQPHELPELQLPRHDITTFLISGAERHLRRFKVKLLNSQ